MKLVRITAFRTRLEAEAAASALEAQDIPCLVKADDCGGMYVDLGAGAQVLVPEDRQEAARALLNCIVSGQTEADAAT